MWYCELFFAFCERAGGEFEDIEVGHNKTAERDVDKRRKEDREVGGNEVQDEDLLGHGILVAFRRFPILIVVELGCKASQERCKRRNHGRKYHCWCEDLSILAIRQRYDFWIQSIAVPSSS